MKSAAVAIICGAILLTVPGCAMNSDFMQQKEKVMESAIQAKCSQGELIHMPSAAEQELLGDIERIIYTNPDNGYVIARMICDGGKSRATIVGSMLNVRVGETIRARGAWNNHPKFGRQFRFTHYEREMPTTRKGILSLLSSGFVKGIGAPTAKLIVAKFGESTLDIFDSNIERLLEIRGIGEYKLEMIRKSWEAQRTLQKIMLFLSEYGISVNLATRIYKEYGDDTIEILKSNPYRLAAEVFGIGFITADSVAMRMGFSEDCPERIQEGIAFTLLQMSMKGHVFAWSGQLLDEASRLLNLDIDFVKPHLDMLEKAHRIFQDMDHGQGDDFPVYLMALYRAENNATAQISRLSNCPSPIALDNLDENIILAQSRLNIRLAEKQAAAVKCALCSKVSVITGGPGTGKTTIIRTILEIFKKHTKKIMLAAPTGRAAKRMSEATGYPASTIHRMLGFGPEGAFGDNNEKLNADVLILDEASMIDMKLMSSLLDRLKSTTTLVIVGDVDQLPSVGAGSVLKDIIRSQVVPVAILTEIFRQAAESQIIVNSHRIIRGIIPELEARTDSDFLFFHFEDPELIRENMLYFITKMFPERLGLDPFRDIQVLCPMRKGILGTEAMNIALQEVLNPDGQRLERGMKQFRVGDKVMQIKNNYTKNVFNGDIGIVSGLDMERQIMSVKMTDGGEEIDYEFSELDEIVLAYAITIHKSQGSEFPAVVIPVSTQHFIMLQRNLIYTGVTRGKKLVAMVGTTKAMSIAVRNNKLSERNSLLARRLVESAR